MANSESRPYQDATFVKPFADPTADTTFVRKPAYDAVLTPARRPSDLLVGKRQNKEAFGSQAFRLEYGPETPRKAIYDDVVTYLGEYRLQASETFYDLLFSRATDGLHIRDLNRGDSLVATAEKSIARGEKLSRRIAERDALQIEENFLTTAEDGDIMIQASPPGKIVREDGNYGFIFVGKVEKIADEHKIIHKNAIRITDATIDQYNQALSRITGKQIDHTTAEDVIADPHFLRKTVSYKEITDVLQDVFQFKPSAWERRRNEWIIEQVQPHINHFIDMIHGGESPEKVFAFLEKIENKALDLKDSHNDAALPAKRRVAPHQLTTQELAEFNRKYNYRPPAAGGSCGSTESGGKSSVSFTASRSFIGAGEDEYGSLSFQCQNGHSNVRPRGELIPNCTTCGVSVKC